MKGDMMCPGEGVKGSPAVNRKLESELGQLSEEFQTLLSRAHSGCTAADCHFYHTMDFGNGEVCEGGWDLRGGEDRYLGFVDVSGQRVFEIGPASGYLSFYMESQGAEVVSFDLPVDTPPELVPLPGEDLKLHAAAGIDFNRKVRNSWWYAHHRFGSKVKAVYGNLYDLPSDLGRYDIATAGCVLLHLSNPVAALQQIANITDKAIIVTDMVRRTPMNLECSYMEFNPADEPRSRVNWWAVSPGAVAKMLRVLGFKEISVNFHMQRHRAGHDRDKPLLRMNLFTVVGERYGDSKGYSDSVGRKSNKVDFQPWLFSYDSLNRHPELRDFHPQLFVDDDCLSDPLIRLEVLLNQFEHQGKILGAIQSSTTWRMSRPLRVAADRVKSWFR
ncbi:MAG: class I SAM-dependent methyltransferase [Acidobacteriota bacterium]